MAVGEIVYRIPPCSHGRHRQRITQSQGCHGRSRGGQPQGAGLLCHLRVEVDISIPRQTGVRVAADAYQSRSAALDRRQNGIQLCAFTALRKGDHHVVLGNHAQIAVGCIGGVHEGAGTAGGGQGAGQLAGDGARLTHAGEDRVPLLSRSILTAGKVLAQRAARSETACASMRMVCGLFQ